MSRNQTKARYVKNIVIVHGKSENIICQYIKSNLRLPLEIYSHNKGKNNIEISSLDSVLNNTVFKSRNGLDKQYLIMPKRYLRKEDLEIFIIMDKDKCSNELFDAYISKAGYTDLRKNKRDYFKLFPINNGGFNLNEIESFHDNLLTVKDVSNLYLFVKKCLDSVETF